MDAAEFAPWDRAIGNFLAVIHDLASGAQEWISRPGWIEFSTTNYCNLRCPMCTHADGVPRLKMGRADAVRVLGELLPAASLITPSAGSEPFLGDLDLVVEQCREHHVHLNVVTNATRLDGDRFRRLADRFQKVHVSFDCHVPEIYERLRVPARLDQVVGNLRQILAAAAELSIPVGFVAVLMAENAPHLPGLVDFVADLGGTEARAEIRLQRLLYISSRCRAHEVRDRYTTDQLREILDGAAARARARKIILAGDLEPPLERTVVPVAPFVRGVAGDVLVRMSDVIRARYPHFCSMASYYLKVNPDGAVFPCCRAPGALRMGNLLESPFDEIWNGSRYQDFRRRMHAGEYPACCRTCDVLTGNPHFRHARDG